MVDGGLSVVRLGRQGLQENPTRDVVDVLFAQKNGLNIVSY